MGKINYYIILKGHTLNYWFAHRKLDSVSGIAASAVLEGPFDSYEQAKPEGNKLRGAWILKTAVFPAMSKSEAEESLKNAPWYD